MAICSTPLSEMTQDLHAAGGLRAFAPHDPQGARQVPGDELGGFAHVDQHARGLGGGCVRGDFDDPFAGLGNQLVCTQGHEWILNIS